MEVVVKEVVEMLNKKFIFVLFILIFSITLNGMKLSELKGIRNLSNYNEVKNIEVERAVNYNNYERNKKKDRVYVNGETIPFNGAGIEEKNNKIIGITVYVNGKAEGFHYRYFDNGQLYIKIQQQNDKAEGEGFEYYPTGKLKDRRIYKNDVIIEATDYYQNGKISRTFKSTGELNGIITGYYENGVKSSVLNVTQDYSVKGEINYIRNGKTTVYEKNGNILGELNFNNGSLLGERQKLYKNGKVKYDFIGGTKDIKGLKAMRSYIEYYDNSDTMKYSCDEVSRDNWKCKEYSKDGSFKQNVDGRKYVSVNNNHHGNIWINIFLGAWNILNP